MSQPSSSQTQQTHTAGEKRKKALKEWREATKKQPESSTSQKVSDWWKRNMTYEGRLQK